MQSQGFHQIQKQSQVFTPQLRQSLEILQVSALELRDVILEELQSNPVLEELPMEGNREENDEIGKDLDFKEENWREDFDNQGVSNDYTTEDGEKRQHFLNSVTIEQSLQEAIIEQAKLSECTEEELKAIEFLVGSLDDKGFLTSSIEEIAELSGLKEAVLSSALEILKYLDPIGLGSVDVQECLLVQLRAAGHGESMAAEIISNHYPLLLRRRIPELAKKLEVSIEEVQEALKEVAALDPAPGRKFKEDSNRTVVADASVEKLGESWVISLNNEYIPRLRLSKTYKDLIAKGSLRKSEQDYIQDKMRSGKYLLNAIEQRQKTLERITETILKFQKDFFVHGLLALHPLTMREAAISMGVHETTVGRAIANKFLETPHGLFPYKYFFTSGYNATEEGGGVSNTSIKEEIAKIVQMEPLDKPYSDQKIVEILGEKDIKIARRTVAKYREELGILSTSLRKKY